MLLNHVLKLKYQYIITSTIKIKYCWM